MRSPASIDIDSLTEDLYQQLCNSSVGGTERPECRRDIAKHIDSLVHAVQTGSRETFAHYVAWSRVLLLQLEHDPAEFDGFMAILDAHDDMQSGAFRQCLDEAKRTTFAVADEFLPTSDRFAPVRTEAYAVAIYYLRNPELSVRHGAGGHKMCLRDMRRHYKQLAVSNDSGNDELFIEYGLFASVILRWAGVLQSEFFESLDALSLAAQRWEDPTKAAAVTSLVGKAKEQWAARSATPSSLQRLLPRRSMLAAPRDALSALETQAIDIARLVVAMYYMRHPGVSLRHGERGRQTCLDDTFEHVKHVIDAMASDSPQLLSDYFSWCRDVLAAAKVPEEVFRDYMVSFVDALNTAFSPDLSEAITDFIEQALEDLGDPQSVVRSEIDDSSEQGRLARQFIELLLDGDRRAAGRLVIEAVEGGLSIEKVYLGVFQPSQYEVGRLWQLNEISVAQEHYCTAATQMIMSQLYPYLFKNARTGKNLVATCVTADLHEIGIRMVCDLYEVAGWDTYYLGANTPAESVIAALLDREADVLAVSVTLGTHVRKVKELIRAIRSNPLCANTKILVGGLPFLLDPNLWEKFGADGSARDARDAVIVGERLTGAE